MNIPQNLFIIIDILVAIILLFGIIKGCINGFAYELINLVFLALSFVAAWFISPILANKVPIFKLDVENDLVNKMYETTNASLMINNIIWIIILVLFLNLIFLLVKPLFKTISKIPVIGAVNRILGGLLGFLRSFIICLLISVLITLPIIKNGKEVKENTVLKYGDDITKFATKYIVNSINLDGIKDELDNFDVDDARDDLTNWLIEQGVLDE